MKVYLEKVLAKGSDEYKLTITHTKRSKQCPVAEDGFGRIVGIGQGIEIMDEAILRSSYPTWDLWAHKNLPKNVVISLPIFITKTYQYKISTKPIKDAENCFQYGFYYVTRDDIINRSKTRVRGISKKMRERVTCIMEDYLRSVEDWLNYNTLEYVFQKNGVILSFGNKIYLHKGKEEILKEINSRIEAEGYLLSGIGLM